MEIYQEPYDPSIADRYTRLETLGEGTYGEVRKGLDKLTGKFVAIKYIRLQSKKHGLPKAIFREMESLRQLQDGLHIVQLLNVFSNDVNVCLVMEYVERDMADIIHNSKHYLPRSHLKAYFQMMLQAIDYCQSRCIIHRDIKPSSKTWICLHYK
jgi:serine/threonine protein kinase